jgi:hypothetical protein
MESKYIQDESKVTPCDDCSERLLGERCKTCKNRRYRKLGYFVKHILD